MIQEDYISFETAKLLKEKGFNNLCRSYWSDNNSLSFEHTKLFVSNDDDSVYLLRPTLQMAMKWLREVHKIGVFPSTYGLTVGVNRSVKHVYGTAIINLETYELMTNDLMPMPTYEEATEAAIKYCLENLI